jgi:hypothetical protein
VGGGLEEGGGGEVCEEVMNDDNQRCKVEGVHGTRVWRNEWVLYEHKILYYGCKTEGTSSSASILLYWLRSRNL